jgi:hypothetical protein
MGGFTTPPPYEDSIKKQAKAKGCTYVNGQTYASDVGNASRDAYIEWISEIAGTSVKDGKSLKEWFVYDEEVSAWWFTKMSQKFGTTQRWLFYQFHVFNHIADVVFEQADTVHIWAENQTHAKALQSAIPLGNKSVSLHVDRPNGKRQRIRRTAFGSSVLGEALVDLLHMIYRLLKSTKTLLREFWLSRTVLRPQKKEADKQWGRPLVLFQTSFPHSWKDAEPYDRFSEKVSKFDRYFGDAPWRLGQRGFDVRWLPNVPAQYFGQWKEARSKQTLDDVAPFMTLSGGAACRILWHKLQWFSICIYLFIIGGVQKYYTYESIPMGTLVKKSCLNIPSLDSPIWIEQYRAMQRDVDPDIVLYRNEFLRPGRRVAAAMKGKTTLLAVQHGLIGDDNTVYRWSQKDLDQPVHKPDYDHVRYAPVPDWFASFGEHHVNRFREWDGYPADHVLPVGGLRHDMLVEKYGTHRDNRTRSSLREELGLPSGRPVVLLCTGRVTEVSGLFQIVVEAVRQVDPDIFVAVKLHQYHGGAVQVQAVAKRKGITAYRVFEEMTYPLIASSDVMVAANSTTILESALLGTPPIAVVSRLENIGLAYSYNGVSEIASSKSDIINAIRRNIEGDRNKKRKISMHLRNSDARACERLAHLINRLVE